jgi:hypothetical protein
MQIFSRLELKIFPNDKLSKKIIYFIWVDIYASSKNPSSSILIFLPEKPDHQTWWSIVNTTPLYKGKTDLFVKKKSEIFN